MKLLITGYGRHGKDSTCEILRDSFGLNFVSSSFFVAERAVRPFLAERKIIYRNLEECYADRVNHRPLWKQAIREYNTPDLVRMGRELFSTSDLYCGLRDIDEFNAMKAEGLFHASIWVDRIQHCPPESYDSMTIRPSDCDIMLDNNSSLSGLALKTRMLYRALVNNLTCLNQKL